MFQLASIAKQPGAIPEGKRKAKKRKGNGYGKGTFIDSKIFLSPAFLSLGKRGTSGSVSTVSVQMLILLLGKRQFSKIKDRKSQWVRVRTDDNKFTLTYKELESYGISQTQATRSFDELLAKGFIDIADPGRAFDKHKALYSLTDDYLNWRLGHQPIRARKQDRGRGYQGKGLGAVKIISTHVNDGHPHTRQRGTPTKKTHTSTRGTLNNEKTA